MFIIQIRATVKVKEDQFFPSLTKLIQQIFSTDVSYISISQVSLWKKNLSLNYEWLLEGMVRWG